MAERVVINASPMIALLGTGRLLVLAKQRGLIASIRDPIDRLTARGFRLSERLIARLLNDAGEG